MRIIYLLFVFIGTIIPNIYVVKESIISGNILLYTNPIDTFREMFASNISSAFISDLLLIVCLFFIWSYREAKKHNIKYLYLIWLYTMVLGLAGGFPLFLYLIEKSKKNGY